MVKCQALTLTVAIWSIVRAAEAEWYPPYCSKVGPDLVPRRSIPQLSAEAQELKPELIQVLTILRHGARTPAERYDCWANYDPQWDCKVCQTIQSSYIQRSDSFSVNTSAIQYVEDHLQEIDKNFLEPYPSWLKKKLGQSVQKRTDKVSPISQRFLKLYDAHPTGNVLGGNCEKGQLLAEGYQQHQLMGYWFAKAYQTTGNSERVPFSISPPLIDITNINKDVYFRSSDMQRTLISGSVFLSSFLSNYASKMEDSLPVPLHTMDLEHESLFPNLEICPALRGIREHIFASPGYGELKRKYAALEERLSVAVGKDDISYIWPGELYDCLMTTVCTGRFDLLPPGLRTNVNIGDGSSSEGQSLLNMTLSAVDDYADFEYTWNDATFARTSIARFMVDFKSEIFRALARQLSITYEGNNSTDAAAVLARIMTDEQLKEFFKLVSNSSRSHSASDPDNVFDAKRLALFAGHDTTIIPFLASLGGTVFDKKWPPYASQIVFEIYRRQKVLAEEEFLFRMIYNGDIITDSFPGCKSTDKAAEFASSDLCPVSALFRSTAWAVPSSITRMCGDGHLVESLLTEHQKEIAFADNLEHYAEGPPGVTICVVIATLACCTGITIDRLLGRVLNGSSCSRLLHDCWAKYHGLRTLDSEPSNEFEAERLD